MRPRIQIAVLLLVVFLCLGIVALIRSIPDSAPPVSFSFLGYSNAPSGQQFAIVTIANKDRFPLRFVSMGAYVWFDSTNTPVGATVLPSPEGTDLPAGSSRTFSVEVRPSNPSNVRCAVELWVRRVTATENLKQSFHKLYRRIPDSIVYGIRSPFIIE